MKRLMYIVIIGLFLIGCGGNSSQQEESVDLPNISAIQGKVKSANRIFRSLDCGKGEDCTENDNSNNNNNNNNNSNPNSKDDFFAHWVTLYLNGNSAKAYVKQKYQGTREEKAYPEVGIFLSKDSICTVSDMFLNKAESSLSTKDTSDSENINLNIPSKVNSGTWYFCAIADYHNKYIENNELNNADILQVVDGEVMHPEGEYFRIKASYEEDVFTVTIQSQNTSDKKYIDYSYDNNRWEYLGYIVGKDGRFLTNHSATFKIKDSDKHNKIYFRANYPIRSGVTATSNIFTLEYGNNNTEVSEKDKILTRTNNVSWGYYTDKMNTRWYISLANSSKKVTVYSLMPIKNSTAGWGVVGKNIAQVNLDKNTISIDNIPINTDDKYEIKYSDDSLNEKITSNRLQSDIKKIRNSTVNIKWWFFSVEKNWYIINKNGDLYRFASKVVTDNGIKSEEYDWQKVDLEGAVPTFFVEDGVKKFRF